MKIFGLPVVESDEVTRLGKKIGDIKLAGCPRCEFTGLTWETHHNPGGMYAVLVECRCLHPPR